MNEFMLSLFSILIFGAVFATVFALGLSRAQRPTRDVIERRLSLINVSNAGDQEFNLLRDRYRSQLSWFDRWLIRLPGVERHVDYGSYSASIIKLRQQAIWSMVLFLISSILSLSAGSSLAFAIGFSFAMAWLPLLRLNWLAAKRLAAFEAQLPEALESITRALRAGYPLMESVRLVSEEMSEPLGAEFKTLFEEVNAGVDLRHALMAMTARVPSISLMAFTTSVLLQRETGGNLTETLTKISLIIRKRFTYQRNVMTLTAEGRMSAWVMGVLPFAVYAMVYMLNPDYASVLMIDPQGRRIAIIGLGFLFLGSLWLSRIIKVEA